MQNYYKFSFCSIFFSNSAHIASTLQLYKMILRAKNLFFTCKSTHILYFKIYAKVHKTHSFFFQSFCHTRREILSSKVFKNQLIIRKCSKQTKCAIRPIAKHLRELKMFFFFKYVDKSTYYHLYTCTSSIN